MSLSNVVRRLTAAELAREPRSLALIAYYDGWGQATGLPPMDYPRVITTAEARHWREGWAEGKLEQEQQATMTAAVNDAFDRTPLHGVGATAG